MALRREREQAIALRLAGKSYSEIKKRLGVGKGTLSYWLHDYPLSDEQLKLVRDWNPRRIENFRNTMRRKREERLERVYARVSRDIARIDR